MLGWFKKKFSKTKESDTPAEEQVQDPVVPEEIPVPQVQEAEPATTREEPEFEAVSVPEEPVGQPHTQEFEEPPVAEEPEETQQMPEVEELSIAEETVEQPQIVDEKEPEPAKEKTASEPLQEKPSGTESMFQRLSSRLAKTKESLVYRMDTLFLGKKEIDADLFDELEEILITADLGFSMTIEILDHARKRVKRDALSDPAQLKAVLKEKLRSFIMESNNPAELVMPESGPFVIMVVGVNGVGKTTTIGKIAKKFKSSGQSVLLVAADTFRAAAVAQLKIWGERNEVEVVSRKEGADPSSVAFDALVKGVAEDYDVVIVDTAGRLHTQVNLMEELKKIKRVMGKKLKTAPHEILLVLDATTGQNAVSQAKQFNEAVTITGLALTKLDGTAKGGIVATVCRELAIPIRFIGIGEQIDDLRDFDPDEFINALFGDDSYQ
ncbi:MAG TPA: signal recognition particle-docking protein FtsY [Desulfocapsa sulfexigens]|nr:signal recognition particle-docking protein FtsY [Desulfocapsa sulfexigens]